MTMLKQNRKKNLSIYTSASFVLLFLLFFYLTFSNESTVSELEGGGGGGDIAVNFGNSDFGSGENFQSHEIVKAAAPQGSSRAARRKGSDHFRK